MQMLDMRVGVYLQDLLIEFTTYYIKKIHELDEIHAAVHSPHKTRLFKHTVDGRNPAPFFIGLHTYQEVV